MMMIMMARYLKSQKKIKLDETEEQNYHQCTKCNFKSPSKRAINKHKKEKHSVTLEHSCDECKFKANSKTGLSNHKESKHGGFCYICDMCIFNCNNLRKFLEHKKKSSWKKTRRENGDEISYSTKTSSVSESRRNQSLVS